MSELNFIRPDEYKRETQIFYGINKGERLPDGYFAELYNFTGDKFPCLATRSGRANMIFGVNVTVSGEPCDVVDNNGTLAVLCTNGIIRCFGEEFDAGNSGKSVVRIGRKLFILPSGAFLDKNDIKFASAEMGDTFTCEPRDGSGTPIEILYGEKPSSPSGGQYWFNSETKGIYRYSGLQQEWNAVPLLNCNMKLTNSDKNYGKYSDFSENDGICIHTVGEEPDINTVVTNVSDTDGLTFETADPLPPGEEFFFVVERVFPEMQFSCVHNNRVWGCCFNDHINEIYASKLGDPLNWNYFRGLSTDSYAVSVGEPGEFTGCEALGDCVVFFKEMCIYAVYGSEPSNFQVVKTDCFGVQKGSEKSVVKINGQLYYKSCHGIMRLSEGALPQCISEDIGADIWKDAIAGTDGNKYYVVMTDASENREMFVYDTRNNLWHKEDIPCEGLFALIYHKNNLLCVGRRKTSIKCKGDSFVHELVFSYISNELSCNKYLLEEDERVANKEDEGRFRWRAETGIRGFDISEYKRLKCVELRMKLGAGAKCEVSIEYDSSDKWESVHSFETEGMTTYRIKNRFDKCDTYRLRLCGYGKMVLYGISEIYEEAGNIGF